MAETTSDQEQQKKAQQSSEPARTQPAIEAPQPEFGGPGPQLSLGPGLGSPDGFEEHAADSRQQRSANRQQRVQTMTAMQQQLGNQRVQRFIAQRRLAGGIVQRETGGQAEPLAGKTAAATFKLDEASAVTNAVYNGPSLTTKDEVPTPAEGSKPGSGKFDVTGTVVATFRVSTKVSLPSVPSGLSTCQAKRVRDAIDNQLSPHEDQHVAAMKQYDGTFETTVTVKGVTLAAAPAALIAAGKAAVDAEGARRKKVAQDASDALDKPPFIVNVDLNCEDDKPAEKNAGNADAQPELAGGESPAAGAEAAPPPAEAA